MKKKSLLRIYNFSDGWLIQLADGILLLIGRDGALLQVRGLTQTKQDAIKDLRDAFANTLPDDYYLAQLGIKTEEKDKARGVVTTALRTIFVAAANVYGVKSRHYSAFGTSGLSKLKDSDMIRNGRLVLSTARKYSSELADEGITSEFLDDTETKLNTFDKARDEQVMAERDRDIETADRITKGNGLYRALVKVCNTGKDLWYEVDEAKYNDYVIYNTPSGQPEPTGIGSIRGTVTNSTGEPVEGVVCKVEGTELTDETDEYGEYELMTVPVGNHVMEFVIDGYETYTDYIVPVFENQETVNDIELVAIEEPVTP